MGKQKVNRVKAFLSGFIFFPFPAWRDRILCDRYSQLDENGVPAFQGLTDKGRLKIMKKMKTPQKLVELLNQARTSDGLTNFMYLNDEGQLYVSDRLSKDDDYLALFKPLTKAGHTALSRANISTQFAFIRRLPIPKMLPFFTATFPGLPYNEFVYLEPSVQDVALYKIKDPSYLKFFLSMPANHEGRTVFQFLLTEQKLKMVLRMENVNDVYDLYKNRSHEVELGEIINAPKEVRQSILKRFPNLTDAVVQAYRKVDFQPRKRTAFHPAHQYQ